MSTNEDDSDIEDDCEIDIYVLDSDGNGVENEEVTVYWGMIYGFETDNTDEDGHVSFWVANDPLVGRSSSVIIYVKNSKYEYDVECGDGYTINLDEDD